MDDFTSTSYLGLRHGSDLLPSWSELQLSMPAALRAPRGEVELRVALTQLHRSEDAQVFPSTLHVMVDLLRGFGQRGARFLWDQQLYPGARWMLEQLRSERRGRCYRHLDPAALDSALSLGGGGPPVVVTEGSCACCGRLAPLAELLVGDARGRGTASRRRHPGVWDPGRSAIPANR